MNETTAELLPCPFCGEQPDRIDDHRVQCCNDQCGNYIKMMNIQDWNKRTDSTTQIAELEQAYHDLAETQLDYQKLTHEQREQIAALRSALESIRDLPNGKSHTRAIGIAIKALARQGIDRI